MNKTATFVRLLGGKGPVLSRPYPVIVRRSYERETLLPLSGLMLLFYTVFKFAAFFRVCLVYINDCRIATILTVYQHISRLCFFFREVKRAFTEDRTEPSSFNLT